MIKSNKGFFRYLRQIKIISSFDKFKVLKEFSHFEENLFESLTVKIEYEAKKSVIITNLYRPNTPIPGTLPSEQLNGFIDKLANLQAELSVTNVIHIRNM